MKSWLIPVLFATLAGAALADDCSVTIDSNDAMQFDKESIEVSKSCKEFTVNLTHSGKLAKNVMGHNWVLSKTDDVRPVSTDALAAGLDNEYLKPDDDRVIAFTALIGGGEKTSVTFPVSKLSENEDYTFFCSFPGHVALMQGKLVLVP